MADVDSDDEPIAFTSSAKKGQKDPADEHVSNAEVDVVTRKSTSAAALEGKPKLDGEESEPGLSLDSLF